MQKRERLPTGARWIDPLDLSRNDATPHGTKQTQPIPSRLNVGTMALDANAAMGRFAPMVQGAIVNGRHPRSVPATGDVVIMRAEPFHLAGLELVVCRAHHHAH